jgi:hypothetical protein
MRKILLLAFIVFLNCCTKANKETRTSERQEISNVDNEFDNYLDLLPRLNLPFETNCERCCDHPNGDYDNALINKFKPEGAAIVGLVDRTRNRAIILVTYPADMLIPSLKVYNLNGKLTGDMTFMTSYCGGEPGYYGKQFFRITSALSLIQIDSTYHLTIDSVDYHTIDTTKVEITRKDYKINDKGQIVEVVAR